MSPPNKRRRLNASPSADGFDSDFTPGVYVYKPTKRSAHAPRRVVRAALNCGPNPLLQYFDSALDLHSASEHEDDTPEWPVDEIAVEDDAPPVLRTLIGLEPHARTSVSVPIPVADDSITESETEDDEDWKPMVPPTDRNRSSASALPPPPEKRLHSADGSLTEPDSDVPEDPKLLPAGRFKVSSNSRPNGPKTLRKTESKTESDSDSDLDKPADPALKPRPKFPLAPGQILLPPFILDRKAGIKVPAAINTYLREYQRDGIRFFWEQYRQKRGGLLGDDMGLVRKTIQVISFLSAIMHKHGDKRDAHRRRNHVSQLQNSKAWRKHRRLPSANATWPTCLIIAPSTVVHNWEREFQTWGYFEVGMYVGTPATRQRILDDFKLGRFDVVLTSFDTARRDIDSLDVLPWSCVLVDEVHRVKNSSSQITKAFHQFECVRRFGLTGTAIQNSYTELWTILDWTRPGHLGSAAQWRGFVVRPLTQGQSAAASEEERAKAHDVALTLRDKLLPEFFLRRTKDIIKDQLPQKIDQVVFCPLSAPQIAAYKRVLATEQVENLLRRNEKCDCGSKETRKNCCHPFDAGDVFRYMAVLIKISNHLALVLPSPTDTAEQTARARALSDVVFAGEQMPKYGAAMLQAKYCGKWTVLDALLRDWRKDSTNKVLIFTKSVKLLAMLAFHLNTRGYGFRQLDGTTKQELRMPMIDEFNTQPEIFVFLISTLAGGTGLNLTGANKVVIFDPNWNPAHDLQAMDRAYRFGQTRDVSVYRLLGAGSVEELIYARQLYKQQQMAIGYAASAQTRYFKGVQGDTSRQGELFGLNNIFRLHEDTLATKMAIERATIAELDWALAHIGPTKKKRAGTSAEDALITADAKMSKEDGDFRGLGALLFDDDPPAPAKDDVAAALGAIGVRYSHRNDDVLQPSRIEEERARTALQKTRRRKSGKGAAPPQKGPKAPEPEWPPRRRHHKTSEPPVTIEVLKTHRQTALIALGFINSPAELPRFAQNFTRTSREEQDKLIARLDEYTQSTGMSS